MTPEMKQAWLDDLKSGEYKHGKHYLGHKDRFCCLGVLCRTIETKFPDLLGDQFNVEEDPNGDVRVSIGDESFWQYSLPSEMLQVVGLTHVSADTLMSLNDESNNYNSAIDYIERNL